jgi:predicted transcriptional regulator
MHQHLTGCLVIARSDQSGLTPVGIVTDRDLSRARLIDGQDAQVTPVLSVMSQPVVVCHHDATLAQLIAIMHGSGVRRLPVVDDDGLLVGIVTADDALVAVTELLRRLTEVMMVEPSLDKPATAASNHRGARDGNSV